MSAPVEDGAAASAEFADGQATVERIIAWTSRLQATRRRAELIETVCSVAVSLTGYEGFWGVRIEQDGNGFVEAACVSGGAPDTTGSVVSSEHLPPGDLSLPDGPAPFFVRDTVAPAVPSDPFRSLPSTVARAPYDDYIRFLSTIGVRGACQIPVVADGVVWARIIGHHPEPMEMTPALQSELRLLGRTAGMRLQELLDEERGEQRLSLAVSAAKVVRNVATSRQLDAGLLGDPVALLELCAASSVIVRLGGEVRIVGDAMPERVIAAVLADVRVKFAAHDRSVITATTMPPACADRPGGYLAMRLDEAATELVVWLRPGRPGPVRWVEIDAAADGEEARAIGDAISQVGRMSAGSSEPWSPMLVETIDALSHEITSIRSAEHRADQRTFNAEVDAFARTVAHELRAPIRAIAQFVEFFLEDAAPRLTEADVEQLTTVLGVAGRGTALLDDLMRYAQLGDAHWQPQPNDLEEAVADALRYVDAGALAGADLTVEADEVVADPSALRQLLASLIGNAATYTSGAARVRVKVRSLAEARTLAEPPPRIRNLPGSTSVLCVEDSGVGIAAEHAERVFGLFKRANEAMPHVTGSGAGLAICQRIARRHGGDIWLTSAPRVGTTVFVVLSP